ncbi:alpha-L-rhamnosidase [Salinibacterium sp. SWN167]|uniref:alpha-L-rhamnosidase n=1 Tax=Salinibacterium sp. SWN167 TaxID=2792054 RepID=UPI0018CF4552|nr:alpha-L-rhamnosidase [Salinibacterium sp. SWN167]MBH0081874.1 family 78 glycoside hydrolase catalytic domain [Salinibacterium sp. SWN167]
MAFLPTFDKSDDRLRATYLRTQYTDDLIGVPRTGLRLTWSLEGEQATAVLGYQISWRNGNGNGNDTEESVTDPTEGAGTSGVLAPGGDLPAAGVRHFRVRVATAAGWTAWSSELGVEAGVDTLSAAVISIPAPLAGVSPYFRRSLTLASKPVRARLRVSSLGVHELAINGTRVGEEHLSPGWTAYQERIVVATHDVTALLTEGENVLGAMLGDGWYRGRLGWRDRDAIYGTELGLIAQLEVEFADGSHEEFLTDDSWRASTGEVTASSIYDGTDIDFSLEPAGWSSPGFDDSAWSAVQVLDVDPALFVPRIAPPIRTIAEFPMTTVSTAERTVLDGSQNIAGWVRLVVRGKKGDTVTVRHAEVLEPDGALHVAALRSAKATDTYVLDSDGEHTLEPRFTFHGFRYADVLGDVEIVSAVGIAISSDTPRRGHFESSHTALNRLHENVLWSQRDNFVSVPTDCPQRDERMGWTGDAQAFAMTANTIFDTESFWRSWLLDLEIDQDDDGAVAAVVPNMLIDSDFLLDGVPTSIMGRAGWGDAATIVPWSIYESYGSTEVLEQQLSSMRRWVEYLANWAGDGIVLSTEFQFGDWLDPDAPGDRPWEAKVSADFVANAFYAHSARLLARSERLVGDADEATRIDALADAVAAETWKRWGTDARNSAAGLAMAIEFTIAPVAEHETLGNELAQLVRDTAGRITTGFLGTPLVLPALTRTGHNDEAFLMLLRRDAPSWLYQVDRGATTIWERWDAIQPDGSIHQGDMDTGDSMISFNHYAYGAVIDWVYRTVAGIAPDAERPGYELVHVAPRPAVGIDWARASVESRAGEVAIDWRLENDSLLATVTLPMGSSGLLDAPAGDSSVITVDGVTVENGVALSAGTHAIVVTQPVIAQPSS